MLRKQRWLDFVAYLTYAFMYLPICIMVLFSFEPSKLALHLTGFTFKWYLSLFQDQALGAALANSLTIAVIAVAFAAVMGTMSAVALSRRKFMGKQSQLDGLYEGLLVMPLVVPEVAMAVSALMLFIAIGMPLGLGTVIVSHIVFCVTYVTLTVLARLEGLDPSLEEAAQDLGASPLRAFFSITLPLIAPGLVAGCLLAFVLSLDDFVITQFTSGVGTTTLPLRVFSLVKFGVSPEINALSTLMMLGTGGLGLMAERLRSRT